MTISYPLLLLAGGLTGVAASSCPLAGGGLSPRNNADFLGQFYVDDTDVFTTTDFGTPVDDTHSLKAGERGPTLLEDFVLRTKITRFDHERVPERAVHARGAAAHGYFESYADHSNLTAAAFLNKAGKRTPVFLRFSTVAGSRGSSDTVRDVHGFAVRFYTEEGNYDITGNNVPVFFIQDAMQFPDLVHAVKPRPDNEMPQAATGHDSAYDFFGQNPSTLHTLMWAMSGHGIPRSYRHLDGFGVHSFRFVNRRGQSKLVKYHFKTKQGRASLVWAEALALAGQDPDFHRKDLFNAIQMAHYPEWEVAVQIVNEEDVVRFGIDLNDPTKIVPEELSPLVPIGKLVLDRNPVNYFAETEQVMFNPGHIVPGIDFSEDPLLQGRLFSYVDTQLNRNMGGPNFEQIPINRPHVPVHNNNRDGAGQQMIHLNNAPYSVNTLNHGSPKKATQKEGNGFFSAPARSVVNAKYIREVSPTFLDYWTQPRLYLNSILPEERQMIVNALRFELAHIESADVRQTFIKELNKVSNDVARRVAQGLGMPGPAPDSKYYHNNVTAGISIFGNPLPTIACLNVGILVTTTSESSIKQAQAIVKALGEKGAHGVIVGETMKKGISTTYSASDAVIFDGIIITDGAQKLFDPAVSRQSTFYPPERPLSIVRDAYFYGKPIGAVGLGKHGLKAAGISPLEQPGVFTSQEASSSFSGKFEEGLKKFKFLNRFPIDKDY